MSIKTRSGSAQARSSKKPAGLPALADNSITSDIDFSDVWSEQDIDDLTVFALTHSEKRDEGKKKYSSRARKRSTPRIPRS